MKTKKFQAVSFFTAALLICTAAFTACGNDSSGEAEITASQTQSETAVQTEENNGEENTENTEISDENTDDNTDGDTDGNTDSGDQGTSSAGGILSAAADAALADAPWPAMERLEDAEFVSDFFLLDMGNENYKDIIILKCPMSANLSELIIIEADDVSAAQADLEARKKKAQEQDAWYPDDVEKAGASIVGTEGSYAYFIMGSEPESVEAALTDYLRSAG